MDGEGAEALCDVEVSGVELLSGECEDEQPEDGGEVVEITEQEAEEECEPMRIAPDPGQPTKEEMEQHRSEDHCPIGAGAFGVSRAAAWESTTSRGRRGPCRSSRSITC